MTSSEQLENVVRFLLDLGMSAELIDRVKRGETVAAPRIIQRGNPGPEGISPSFDGWWVDE